MSANAVYWNSGRLESGGTTFGSAFPHAGTDLGNCARIVFEPTQEWQRVVRAEDNGTDEVLIFGGDAVLSFRLNEVSNAAWAALLPNTRLDDGDRVMTWPVAPQAAPTLTPLVFSPNNTEAPALIIYAADVVMAREIRNPLSATRRMAWDFVVYGTPNGNGRVAEMGPLSKLNTS